MKLISMLIAGIMGIAIAGAEEVPKKATDVNPVLVGSVLPDIILKNKDGERVKLKEKVKEKPTVLIYYRGGWCPFCMKHLSAVGKSYKQLKDMGYQVIAVSPDNPAAMKRMGEKSPAYTVLSDSKMTGAKKLGIAFKVSDELVKLYKEKYKIDIERDSGETHHLLPVPSVFIIDKDAVVQFHYVNPNYKYRLGAELLIAAAKDALQASPLELEK